MAEFAGYVGNLVPPTDWGKIGTDLFDKYNKVKEDREAQREKIDNDFSEAFAKIGDYEQTTDQSVNELVSRGANDIRDSFKTQYDLLKKGAITMADFKLYKNTAMSDWSTFNKGVKTFGANIADAQKIITDGKMSGFGQYNMLNYSKLGDLKNARIMPNPQTGRLYLAQVDPETGTIASDNDVYSPSAMLNPSNLVDLKVNINDGVNAFLKRIADYGVVIDQGNGRIKNIEDARKNPAFNKALDAQVNSFTVTPRSTTSVLTDYVGDYKFFESDAQKKDLIEKGTPEDNLIKVERKNGVYQPIPTEDQKKVAEEYVRNQIEVGVGYKESQTQGFAPKAPRSGGGGTKPTEGSKARKSALKQAISYAEILQKDPYNGFVINKIKDAYRTLGTVDVQPLMDQDNNLTGYDIYKVDKNGQRIILKGKEASAPSGAFIRKGGAVQGIFEALNKDQKRGEESIDWGTATEEYEGDQSRLSERLPLIKAGGKTNAQKQPTPSGNVKIVTLDMVKQKLGKGATQSQIDAYTKQLESTGNFKVQTK
jgi:hypothetical protein